MVTELVSEGDVMQPDPLFVRNVRRGTLTALLSNSRIVHDWVSSVLRL